MTSMEQLRGVALAYYENLPEEQQQLANKLFNEIAKNGGRKGITLRECEEFLRQCGMPSLANPEIFKGLDRDGNGTIEFDEFITLFYIGTSKRTLCCGKCGRLLTQDYFTCLQCFREASDPYNLCCACYPSKNYNHHAGATFMDNNAFLLETRDLGRAAMQGSTMNVSKTQKLPKRENQETPKLQKPPNNNSSSLPTEPRVNPNPPPMRPQGFPNQTSAGPNYMQIWSNVTSTVSAADDLAHLATFVAPNWFDQESNTNQAVDDEPVGADGDGDGDADDGDGDDAGSIFGQLKDSCNPM